MERCSDGGEDQGAEEAFMGQKKANNHDVSFGKSRLARVALPFSALLSG
jgi:hypothetical protein